MANYSHQFSRQFVDFHCWYAYAGSIYIGMEYQRLGDLNHHVRNSGVFEESIARGIAEQILQGVFVLHELGFMHRDIKPEVHPQPFILYGVKYRYTCRIDSSLEYSCCLTFSDDHQTGRLRTGEGF